MNAPIPLPSATAQLPRGDRKFAGWGSHHQRTDDDRPAQRTQPYRPSLAATRRCSSDFHQYQHRAGRRCERTFSLGDLNPGTISINGQREFSNAFIVNGSDAEEDVNMGTAIVPNLDSIDEFRILTNNFDAEYGEFSGGQIVVTTKSGGNTFHGNVFEFLRNTNLDARNYFSPTRGTFDQNQYGGTFGGPIHQEQNVFLRRLSGHTHDPRPRYRANCSRPLATGPHRQSLPIWLDLSPPLTSTGNTIPTTVNSCSAPWLGWANTLTHQLGYNVFAGEPYYYTQGEHEPGNSAATYATTCASTAECVASFCSAFLDRRGPAAPAANLLQYIPSAQHRQRHLRNFILQQPDFARQQRLAPVSTPTLAGGLLTGYYFLDNFSQINPYPVAQGGASVPGFNANNVGRAQLFGLTFLTTLHNNAVNEAHFSYLRDSTVLGKPEGGLGVSLSGHTRFPQFRRNTQHRRAVVLKPKASRTSSSIIFSIGTNTNELNAR